MSLKIKFLIVAAILLSVASGAKKCTVGYRVCVDKFSKLKFDDYNGLFMESNYHNFNAVSKIFLIWSNMRNVPELPSGNFF